ncbi:hypothetical protein [Aeromonas phage Aer_P220]|uniref:Uncharacterized protein n=1 Tax=Aeromonas phage Aer_P220 TaxID=2951227 RepID=A0A9E7NKW3_9CAUD|nr:hypothetical protein [Aeromonas phage Aer_P220]
MTKEQALAELLDKLQDAESINPRDLNRWYSSGLTATEVALVTEQFSKPDTYTE